MTSKKLNLVVVEPATFTFVVDAVGVAPIAVVFVAIPRTSCYCCYCVYLSTDFARVGVCLCLLSTSSNHWLL